MGISIETEDVIDTALDLASNQAEREIKKGIKNSSPKHRDIPDQLDIPENTPSTPPAPQPKQNMFQKVDNLGQDLYRSYGRLRNNIEEGDYLHATRNGFKVGNELIGGDVGRTMRIGRDIIDVYDAIKDGDYGKAARLGLNILKNGAFDSFGLSTKEQMLYDRATSGLNYTAQAERIEQHIKDNLDRNIEEARLKAQYPHEPTRRELINEKVNEMRRQELQKTMQADAAQMPTPEQYAAQNYSFGQMPTPEQYAAQNYSFGQTPTPEQIAKQDYSAISLPNTEEDVNTVAMADTKNNPAPQPLSSAQLAWINSRGRQ